MGYRDDELAAEARAEQLAEQLKERKRQLAEARARLAGREDAAPAQGGAPSRGVAPPRAPEEAMLARICAEQWNDTVAQIRAETARDRSRNTKHAVFLAASAVTIVSIAVAANAC